MQVRTENSLPAIDRFLADSLDAAAGVRQPLVAAARLHPGLRVIDGSFMVIRQAAGVPHDRTAAATYLAAFIEEMKRSGFVARALWESGVNAVSVAPPA
jgi:polar amino acid transport system substrate-binding protein